MDMSNLLEFLVLVNDLHPVLEVCRAILADGSEVAVHRHLVRCSERAINIRGPSTSVDIGVDGTQWRRKRGGRHDCDVAN